ncbi:MAG: glycosyltransferase [Clostridiales bacterium]|nr:glycosyltransferase [Clostridiales bacterium]
MSKISVIIPVYKVEKYLDKCVESVVNQTYKNLEIILVDDGSPDRCPQMCDEWAKKDERIKVVHKQNGGLSSARNAGMEVATGEYIAFLDSDDFVDITMYQKLYDKMLEERSDICMCGITHVYEDGNTQIIKETNLTNLNKENVFKYLIVYNSYVEKNIFYTDNIMGSVWRSLYKKELLDNLLFTNIYCEDIIFMIDVFQRVNKISAVDENLYYYLQRQGSITKVCNESQIRKHIDFAKLMKEKIYGYVDEDAYKAQLFHMYETPVSMCIYYKNKELFKRSVNDKFLSSLNTKENYKARQNLDKNFKRKILNFLVHHKMYTMARILYRLVGKS